MSVSKIYNPITGEEIHQRLPPDMFEGNGECDSESSTESDDVDKDYTETMDVLDGPFQNAGNKDMRSKEKFDKDVVTPYLFSKLIGGSLSLEQSKKLGDLKSRRKLYRELTNLFRHLEN